MLQRWRGERAFHAHESARMDELNGLPLASFRSRAMAYGIDLVIIALVWGVLTGWMWRHHPLTENGCAVTFTSVITKLGGELKELAESVLYFTIALKLGKGQTPGKRFMKIRVVSLTDHNISWWIAIERALGYGASLLEGGFGFLQYFLNQNRMCVHDRIAETIVVDLRRPRLQPALHAEPELPASSPSPALPG